MAKKTKDSKLSIEERLEQALIPNWDEPYKLPENWCWVRADAIASIYTGNSINERVKEEKYTGRTDGLVYLATKDIDFDATIDYDTNVCIPQFDGFKVAPKYSTLLCIEGGSAGRKIGFITQDVCFVNKLCAFVPHGKINPKYLYYVIQSDAFKKQFDAKKHGLIGGVSVKEVSSIFIPFAPVEIQNKIVDFIESVFNKLDESSEKAQEVAGGFEIRKAAILHKAFSGELTANWRNENGVSINNWEHHRFSDLCKIVRGGSPRPAGSPEFYGGDIPFMKVADITRITTPYVEGTEHFIKTAGLKKTRMVKANTLLLTNSGATLGVPAICTFDTTFNDGIAAFLDLEPKSLLFYYYFWTMKTTELRAINKGAAQPNLNTDIIGAVELNVPSLEEQLVIAEMLEKLISREQQVKETAEAVIEQIDTMKKAILARAFRGELGTNDPSEESAVELLKSILSRDEQLQISTTKSSKRVSIPSGIRALVSNVREEEILKLLLKSASQPISIQEIMALSSKKFELMDALRTLEKKQLITKNEFGEYSLTR